MNHKNTKNKLSNHSFSREICLAILLQSSAGLYWDNGALTQKRWKVKVRVLIKWGIEKNPFAPLLLQKTDMNLFSDSAYFPEIFNAKHSEELDFLFVFFKKLLFPIL